MLDYNRMASDAAQELTVLLENNELTEELIIKLFLMLPKDRQKAVLGELWSEFKPEKPKGLRNFKNLPF